MSIGKSINWSDVEKLRQQQDVQGLINLLNYKEDANIRKAAAEALGTIGNGQAVEPLLTRLKDVESKVQSAAYQALVKINDRSAIEPLIALLKDRDYEVRFYAVIVLKEIGDDTTVEPLIAALDDGDEHVRRIAAEALGKFGDTRALKPLVVAANKGERAQDIIDSLQHLLQRTMQDISPEDLHELASLEDKSVTVYGELNPDSMEMHAHKVKVDFSPVRQLARQELAQRGL